MFKHLGSSRSPSSRWTASIWRYTSRDNSLHSLLLSLCSPPCMTSSVLAYSRNRPRQARAVIPTEDNVTRQLMSLWYQPQTRDWPVGGYSYCGNRTSDIIELYEMNRVFGTQQVEAPGPIVMEDVLQRISDGAEDSMPDGPTFDEKHDGVYQYAGLVPFGGTTHRNGVHKLRELSHSFSNVESDFLEQMLVDYYKSPHTGNRISNGVCSEFETRLTKRLFKVYHLCMLLKLLTPYMGTRKMFEFDCVAKICHFIGKDCGDITDMRTLLTVYKSVPKVYSHVLDQVINNGVNWQICNYPLLIEILQIVKKKCPKNRTELSLLSTWITANPGQISKSLIVECLTIFLRLDYVSLPVLQLMLSYILASKEVSLFSAEEWGLVLSYCRLGRHYDQAVMDMACKEYLHMGGAYTDQQLCTLLQGLGGLNYTQPRYIKFFSKVQSRLLQNFYRVEPVQLMKMVTSLLLMNRVPFLLTEHVYATTFLSKLSDLCLDGKEHGSAFRDFIIFTSTFLPGPDWRHQLILLLPTPTHDGWLTEADPSMSADADDDFYHSMDFTEFDEANIKSEAFYFATGRLTSNVYACWYKQQKSLHDLARYNKIGNLYMKTKETHTLGYKICCVKLFLGSEEFHGEGQSWSEAKHDAACFAMQKTHYTQQDKSVMEEDEQTEGKADPVKLVQELLAASHQEPCKYKIMPHQTPAQNSKCVRLALHLGDEVYEVTASNWTSTKQVAAVTALGKTKYKFPDGNNNAQRKKLPKKLINELAWHNKIDVEYHRIEPDESQCVTPLITSVTLYLGKEEFTGSGHSLRDAKQSASALAWETSTKLRELRQNQQSLETIEQNLEEDVEADTVVAADESPSIAAPDLDANCLRVQASLMSILKSLDSVRMLTDCHGNPCFEIHINYGHKLVPWSKDTEYSNRIRIFVPSAECFCANKPGHLLGHPASLVRLAKSRGSAVILLNFHLEDSVCVSIDKKELTMQLKMALQPYLNFDYTSVIDWSASCTDGPGGDKQLAWLLQ